jgi:hypothetical protein
MSTVTLYGTARQKYAVLGNVVYEADANGRIPNVAAFDEGECQYRRGV